MGVIHQRVLYTGGGYTSGITVLHVQTLQIAGLVTNVAYPDWIFNDTSLNAYYTDLVFASQDDWFTILNKVTYFQNLKQFRNLIQPTNRHNFNGNPSVINAWYQPELNSITIPMSILNTPFFNPAFPTSMNYGAIGVVIGHEVWSRHF